MANPTFNPVAGPDRVSLEDEDADTIAAWQDKGLIAADGRRARSSYFDGRFLTARDLTRDQNHLLTRQGDLSRAGGVGVIAGLLVEPAGSRSLRVRAGHGVTSAGELVGLPRDVVVGLDDVPELARLDATAGLSSQVVAAAAERSGVFVLALRPIEYTTRQITRHPTTVGGRRGQEAGDIVEGVALTLVPWRDTELGADPWRQRSRVAYTLFVEQSTRGIPAETLPVAMLRLDRGVIRWLDTWLVRREVGADQAGVVGINVAPRALREAHLVQYDHELRELMGQRQARGGLRFAASQYFEVLPAAGRMPAAAIDPADFTQHFFPAQMVVELSIVNDDEVTALVEESLLLPPIDITGAAEDLDYTALQVLIPMSREARRRLTLNRLRRTLRAPVGVPSKRLPIDILELIRPRPAEPAPEPPGTDVPIEAAWRAAVAGADQLLWFVRRPAVEVRQNAEFSEPRREPLL